MNGNPHTLTQLSIIDMIRKSLLIVEEKTLKLKKTRILPLVCAALIILLFGSILTVYTQPMKDISLDLSLMLADGEEPEAFEDHGWTVFCQEGETATILSSDSIGGYSGIEPGETLYFSRIMTEELDSPTMQLGAANRNFAVFLDGELVYTDCPGLDNRIGYLDLPMKEWDVMEPLTISLPVDYHGKTLTIAQSTPLYSEGGAYKAYPASIQLYCGYSYESGLIAESFSTAFLAAALFLAGVLLLIAFLRNHKLGASCMAIVAFLCMTILLLEVSFLDRYLEFNEYDTVGVCQQLAALALMVYLTDQAGKAKRHLWILDGLYAGVLAVYLIAVYLFPSQSIHPVIAFLKGPMQEWFLTICMIFVLAFGILVWRKENRFYRLFAPLSLIVLAVVWTVEIIKNGDFFWQQIMLSLSSGQISFLCNHISPTFTALALATALVETLRCELEQRTEKQLVEQHRELELASYKNMYRQHEEVMILRHDMAKHFQTLRELTSTQQIHDYLDLLIGQNKKVRPVIQSGNKMLDIILNSKLGMAADAGIHTDIVKAEAPEVLPLTDADLCSVVMNIMDNALAGAAASGTDDLFLRLDFHIKGNFFVFICENSAQIPAAEVKKETVPKHGLGLKIVRSIADKYEGLVDTEQSEDRYRIRVALPLL